MIKSQYRYELYLVRHLFQIMLTLMLMLMLMRTPTRHAHAHANPDPPPLESDAMDPLLEAKGGASASASAS